MSDELTLSLRPRTFDEMIGSEKLIRQIRKIIKSEKVPKSWLLCGDTGAGKTTIARIMALSLQCRHQKQFGVPCKKCFHYRRDFDIREINASDITGIDALREAVQGTDYHPKPGSRRRVYILDECHQLSQHAQNLLLKYTEDCPSTTNWILCTTRADKILPTLQSRCTIFTVPSLELEGVKQLVKLGCRKLHCDRDRTELVEKLMERNITSPRLVLKAVQKYSDPETTADEASEVTLVADADTYALCRAVVKGSWEDVAKALSNTAEHENIAIRKGVAGYLNAILLSEKEISHRTEVLADAILKLHSVHDDMPATAAILYKVCKYFARDQR